MAKLHICLILLSLIFANVYCQDKCALPANHEGIWRGTPFQVSSCFNSIPESAITKTKTLNIVEDLWKVYSFSDPYQANLPPFNINVDWDTEINRLKAEYFDSDYDFHNALAAIFMKLKDAHTLYLAPRGYSFFLVRPFRLVAKYVEESIHYFAGPSLFSDSWYKEFCRCDIELSKIEGKRILRVDGLPIDEFIELELENTGFYTDKSSRLNAYLSEESFFETRPTSIVSPGNDENFFTFEGSDDSLRFPIVAVNYNPINSTEDLKNRNYQIEIPSKRNVLEEDEHILLSLLQSKVRALSNVDDVSELVKKFASPNYYKHVNLHQRIRDNIKGLRSYLRMLKNSEQPVKRDEDEIEDDEYLRDFVKYEEAAGLYYHSYKDTTVLRLTTFSPEADELESFAHIFENIVSQRFAYGLNKNLIIDVSGNGGGYICLNYWLLSFLISPWRGGTYEEDNLYVPYDFKKSSLTDDLFKEGYFDQNKIIDPNTTLPFPNKKWYEDRERTYGDRTSAYTQPYWFGECGDFFEYLPKSNWVFDKILILTDGRCGSSCSNFMSVLQERNKTRVAYYGGLLGVEKDTSQFSGGMVLGWNEFVYTALSGGITKDWLNYLPTSARLAFNFLEAYSVRENVPRQLIRINPDFYIPFHDALDGSDLNLAKLYHQAEKLFAEIPPGLPGPNTGITTLGIVLIVISVIIGLLVLILVVYLIIQCTRKNI